MDDPPVMLSTKSQATARTVGDPPNLGRVERVARGMLKGPKKRSRSGKRSSRQRRERRGRAKGAQRVTLLIFLISILIILTALGIWSEFRHQQSVISDFEQLSKPRFIERIESRFKSPTEDQACAIVSAALAAKDEAAVVANFRLNGVAPAEVLKFLRQEEELKGPGIIETWIGSVDFNNTLMESLLIRHEKNKKIFTRIVMLTPDELGVWRLDFDSFSRRCMPSWEAFLSGEATEGTVRVWFSKDNYYNGPYADETEWLCFSMARMDEDMMLFGYCRKTSPQGMAMVSIMNRAQERGKVAPTSFRATLVISRAAGAEKRQFEIKRVLAEDWLLTDKAFDGLPAAIE